MVQRDPSIVSDVAAQPPQTDPQLDPKGERVEKALRESQENFRTIFLANPAGMAITALEDGRFLEVNPAFERIIGYTRSETIGKTTNEARLWYNPDDRAGMIEAVRRHGLVDSMEIALRHRSGERRYMVLSVVPYEFEGTPAILSCFSDITERIVAEQALQLAQTSLDVAADIVLWVRKDSSIAYVNAAAHRLLEYEREEILSMRISDIDTNFSPAQIDAIWAELEAKQNMRFETEMTTKSGHRLPVEVQLSLFDSDTEHYVIAFARDITERQEAERRRHSLEGQLTQSQKMEAIGTLAGGIAHDFNNLLGAISGYTELVSMSLPDDNPAHEDIKEVLRATELATQLAQQILTFSRQAEPTHERLFLLPILKETLKLLRASIPTTIEIRQTLPSHPIPIVADAAQIHQVIMNLCTNAYHAMGEEGVLEVTVETVTVGRTEIAETPDLVPGEYALLRVTDTGKGMDEETVRRCFEPFFTTKEKGAGTGLGLSVAHGIVENHQGKISVQSRPHKGTEFSVYLPQAQTAAGAPKSEESPIPQGSGHALVVDDKPELAALAGKMLSHLGYTAEIFTSSRDALEAFRADPTAFDLVLTDQTMPELTGTALAQAVLTVRPGLPVIISTGYSESVDEAKAIEIGAQALLHKPLRLAELASALHRFVGKE